MKAFTDLTQSKVLAEFLPLESADMRYAPIGDIHPLVWEGNPKLLETDSTPCWSLAALLGVLPVMIDYKGSLIRLRIDKGNVGQDDYAIWYDDLDNGLSTNIASESKNLVDACYDIIIKLHEQNIL